jgi:hypothetical protein
MNRADHDLLCRSTGKIRVLERMCDTCIFRPGAKMDLEPERFREVEQGNIRRGTLLTCHSTLSYGPYPDFGPAACFGFWERHGAHTAAGRIALLIGILRVTPPGAEPDGEAGQ